MPIKKQEFYEGAALHLLARGGGIDGIRWSPPFFLLNETIAVHIKYSTRTRSPWGFTFVPDEQLLLDQRAPERHLILALVCGADGIVALPYSDYRAIAAPRSTALRIACFRKHGEHYEISGPDGGLDRKVSPSNWRRLLEQ